MPLRAEETEKYFELPSEHVLNNHPFVSREELVSALGKVNDPVNFKPPSIFYYVLITVVAVLVMLAAAWVLLLAWLLTLCDIIVFCLFCYFLRKLFMAVYIWRRQRLDNAYFPGLRKTIRRLNEEIEGRRLVWSLEPRAQWLQLAPLNEDMLAGK
jgi:hypothetical protein